MIITLVKLTISLFRLLRYVILIGSSFSKGLLRRENCKLRSSSAALVIMEATIFQASIYINHPGHFPIMREETF